MYFFYVPETPSEFKIYLFFFFFLQENEQKWYGAVAREEIGTTKLESS